MNRPTVLLVSANLETVPQPVYPTGMARLAGALRRTGWNVRQFDVLAHGQEALAGVIADARPAAVGVSLRNVDNADAQDPRQYVGWYARLARQIRSCASCPIVLGGSGFSLFPRQLMRLLDADYGVVGPGESALPALLEALEGGRRPTGVPNVLTREQAEPPSPAPQPPPPEGQWRPAAEHDPAVLDYYWRTGGMIGVQTKVGCPGRCIYCTYPLIDGDRVRLAEIGAVADELECLARAGVDYVFMADSVFNLDRACETALADEIIRRGLRLSWGAFFRPSGLDREYLDLLAASGLRHAEFGTDSLSPPVLEALDKGFTVEDILAASRLAGEAGVFCAHYLAFGGPGETVQTIRQTMANAAALAGCAFLPFAGIRVYPGTAMHRLAVGQGAIAAADDCLSPRFYFAPGLDAERIWAEVSAAAAFGRNWITPGRFQLLDGMMRGMRRDGMKGPLWDHLLTPQPSRPT